MTVMIAMEQFSTIAVVRLLDQEIKSELGSAWRLQETTEGVFMACRIQWNISIYSLPMTPLT